MSIVWKPSGADIFNSQAQVLINPVNCVGVMGAGLAKIFKSSFPDNYQQYKNYCDQKRLRPGGILVCSTGKETPQYIINLATKDHWSNPSKPSWVSQGLDQTLSWAAENNIQTVACPALGAGLGKLSLDEVQTIMIEKLTDSPIEFELFAPRLKNDNRTKTSLPCAESAPKPKIMFRQR